MLIIMPFSQKRVSYIDPKSEDFDQILATRWIKVVDITLKNEAENTI